MSFKVLVRDSGSELAELLAQEFEELPIDFLCPGVETFAWRHRSSLESYFKDQSPNVVINLLPDNLSIESYEQEEAVCKTLSRVCSQHQTPLLQISSFDVFGKPYSENGFSEADEPAPPLEDAAAQFYMKVEEATARADKHMIFRLPWLLDLGEACLLAKTAGPTMRNEKYSVSSYYRGTALTKMFITHVITACVKQILCGAENWGVFTVHCSDTFSEAEFADALLRLLQSEFKEKSFAEPEIIAEKDGARLMAGNAHISGERLTDNFGIQLPSWRHGFKSATKNWLKAQGFYEAEKTSS